ncbi:MAG: BACON domain-containing protein [Bacteroidaceae bacterium]|nr:BACON domain-containing protein [Bacteroidaceae bacterium]MBR5466335.1 BACON domain-containing protein [Bacteroidaceae bacterium]
MKIKSIITVLLSAIFFIGCSEEQVAGTYPDFNISTSYISISDEGGSTEVKLTANEAWKFSEEKNSKDAYLYPIPAWLTISQTEGEAGITTLTFSAEASNAGREVELKIISGSKSIFIKVRQGEMTASEATCKEVNEAPDGKNFVVSGTITRIMNTTYGNWYMTDGTAELYIYGTLDAAGQTKNFTSLGLEVGDKVTIEGPKSTYNGSAQMVDVTVKKIEKALLKIVTDPIEISKEGGEFEVKLATKGKGAYFNISEECQEWVSYENVEYKEGIATKLTPNPADTIIYTFNALPNDASARTGAINFFANEGEPIAYTFTQAGGITDVTIAEFLAAEVNDAAQYRIVGHVTGFNKYNNNFYVKDWSGEVYAYYVETQGIKNIAIGDFVTLVGKRAEYNGTPQMPKGTLLEKYTASPEVSVAEFLTKEDSKEVYYKLTGTITSIDNPTYGNIYITDANGDEVYVYGLLPGYGASGDAKKGLVDDKGLKEGDTITIVGNKASHKGSPQVGNAVYLSHESK